MPHIGEIGVAALHERAQQVQRGGGVAERLDLPCRIGPARLVGELDAVDDVAAIARQLLAVLLFHRRGARLGELAGDAADLHHRQRGGIGEHDRHLQEHAQEVADVVGAEIVGAGLGEALGAVAALQQETFAHGDPAERLLEAARLTGKDQRRKAGELPLDRFERGLVGVFRDLENGLLAPTVARPTLGHDAPPLDLSPSTGEIFQVHGLIHDGRRRKPGFPSPGPPPGRVRRAAGDCPNSLFHRYFDVRTARRPSRLPRLAEKKRAVPRVRSIVNNNELTMSGTHSCA